MKAIFLIAFLFVSYSVGQANAENNFTCSLPNTILSRGIEIRYITVADKNQTEITIDHKTYKLFKTRDEAIQYVTNMSVKTDYVIVYVMNDVARTTEVLEIGD